MTEKEFQDIKNSVAKLEKKGSMNLWLQFMIFPLILGGIGYYFQNIVQQSEKRMEQLKMTQSIVNNVFTDTNYEKTIAMRGILYEVLENDALSKKIGELIDIRLKDLILNGTTEELANVINAVEKFSDQNDSLKQKLNSTPELRSKLSKYDAAVKKEKEAFDHLLNNDFSKAEEAFRKVDEIYPTFHQAYEIYRHLRKNRAGYDDAAKVKEIQKHIVKNLNWGAPKDVVKLIERQADQ